MRIKIEWHGSSDPGVENGTAVIHPGYLPPMSIELPAFLDYMRLQRIFDQQFEAGRASKTAEIKNGIQELMEKLE